MTNGEAVLSQVRPALLSVGALHDVLAQQVVAARRVNKLAHDANVPKAAMEALSNISAVLHRLGINNPVNPF